MTANTDITDAGFLHGDALLGLYCSRLQLLLALGAFCLQLQYTVVDS